MLNPQKDTFICPKCGQEATNVNLTELGETNKWTYRCPKCEFVFTTTESFIPGTLDINSDNENKEDL